MKTLVHFDVTGTQPLGVWWVNASDEPESLYVDPESPEAARGRVLVFGKTSPDVTWMEWFDILTERPPYFEVWATYDSGPYTPPEMLNYIAA